MRRVVDGMVRISWRSGELEACFVGSGGEWCFDIPAMRGKFCPDDCCEEFHVMDAAEYISNIGEKKEEDELFTVLS